MSSSSSEIVQQGWLTKSPPAKGLFRPRWRRRWFILRNGSFPNQFVLEYFTDESCRRQKGQINLDECEQLDLSSNPQITAPLSVQDRHKYTFNLRTPSRVYYLAADTEIEMDKWVKCLCQVCGLKTVEHETEMFAKPVDENNQPESTYNRDSDESSPSLSVHLSGPYIPISQCHTGKPIIFNDNNESPYYNTSFPFPPKVNWATHPAKKEGDEPAVSPSDPPSSLNAPPRPPKKFSSTAPSTLSLSSPSAQEPPKIVPQQTCTTRSVFPYDSLDDTHDSSSTCSSLHSPPGSAGVVYSNISDVSPVHQNLNNNMHGPPSGGPKESLPPRVDRNLKPDLRRPLESPSYKSSSQQSPTGNFANGKHCSRAMTLPSKISQRGYPNSGPTFDRHRKPNENPIMLGPTPAQMKTQAGIAASRYPSQESNTSTLPSRRVGPGLSLSDKKPLKVHEYEPAPELTYTQLDYKVEAKPSAVKVFSHKRSQSASHTDTAGGVEYKLIDHVKTQALNQIRQDRKLRLVKN